MLANIFLCSLESIPCFMCSDLLKNVSAFLPTIGDTRAARGRAGCVSLVSECVRIVNGMRANREWNACV